MKCRICGSLLTDWESVRKDTETGEYLDTCSYCVAMSKPEVITNIEDEDDYFLTLDLDKD